MSEFIDKLGAPQSCLYYSETLLLKGC
jgi:hypothetical protein